MYWIPEGCPFLLSKKNGHLRKKTHKPNQFKMYYFPFPFFEQNMAQRKTHKPSSRKRNRAKRRTKILCKKKQSKKIINIASKKPKKYVEVGEDTNKKHKQKVR